MKVQVEVDVLASDWQNLICTFIDGGVGREWWREVEVQQAQLGESDDPEMPPLTGRWLTADYGNEHVYRDTRHWRIVLRMHKQCVGDKCVDGKEHWGWDGPGSKVVNHYIIYPWDLAKVANLAPDLFGEWLGSGERNLTTKFDANCADSFMQLAAFGVEVYG